MASADRTTENSVPDVVPGPTRISLHGDIDGATSAATWAYIRARLPNGPGDLEFDLGEVGFMGSAGPNIFARLRGEGHKVHCVHAHGSAALTLSALAGDFVG